MFQNIKWVLCAKFNITGSVNDPVLFCLETVTSL